MQRYFVKDHDVKENMILITDENDIHHIKNVMRMNQDAEIVCIDEKGQAYQCQIETITDTEISTIINYLLDDNGEMPVDVTIFQGLPKKNKLEFIIQKGTELGCTEFSLFSADRSIVKWDKKKIEQKLTRLNKISVEASEQCGRSKIPNIGFVSGLEDTLKNAGKFDLMLFAYEEEAKTTDFTSIAQALQKCSRGVRIGLFIGPEGGFSVKEAALLRQNKVESVRLGPRILRTETASLYALASISYHFEEMRCQ